MNDTSSIFHTVGASSILHNLKNDMSVAMLESQQVNDQINAPPMVRKISDYTADEDDDDIIGAMIYKLSNTAKMRAAEANWKAYVAEVEDNKTNTNLPIDKMITHNDLHSSINKYMDEMIHAKIMKKLDIKLTTRMKQSKADQAYEYDKSDRSEVWRVDNEVNAADLLVINHINYREKRTGSSCFCTTTTTTTATQSDAFKTNAQQPQQDASSQGEQDHIPKELFRYTAHIRVAAENCRKPAASSEEVRERNRLHAQASRLRKKQKNQVLVDSVSKLRHQQLCHIQAITDSSTGQDDIVATMGNAQVQELLLRRKSLEDIPSIADIHISESEIDIKEAPHNESRQERERVNAKRYRKIEKIKTRKTEELIEQLESENALLLEHL